MPSSTAGMIFQKAACKYCSAEISVNSLARHEADCATASPEVREARKHARTESERRRRGKPLPERKQRLEECEFCHDQIGVGSIVRHRVKCANRTPTEREYAKQQRHYQQTHYEKKNAKAREKYRESVRLPLKRATSALDKPVVPDTDRRSIGWTGTNGKPIAKPMSVTMLVDEDNLALALGRVVIQKLPELLPQLIPGLSIEAFATKAHRAGKVQ